MTWHRQALNECRTNIFSADAKGIGVGGAFTTINDIKLFWENLLGGKLISYNMLNKMIDNKCEDDECYGFGIWLRKDVEIFMPYFEGCDPGVSFISSYDSNKKIIDNFSKRLWR